METFLAWVFVLGLIIGVPIFRVWLSVKADRARKDRLDGRR